MKEKKKLVKVIVYALLLLVMLGIGFGVKLLIMVVCILLLENLLLFVLQLVKPKKHRTGSVLSLICSLIKYAAFIAVICFGLTILGVNITTIIASIGILALIVGFSAESLIADIVTGTFMLLENQYNVGDIVEVNGFRGVVTSIGIRTTCITDSGDNVKIINNRCRHAETAHYGLFLCNGAVHGLHHSGIQRSWKKRGSHHYRGNGLLRVPRHLDLHRICILPHHSVPVSSLYLFLDDYGSCGGYLFLHCL